ncbi:MAG TPA: Gfo/Idh/MocA family oxidoreductase [Verrucomicrobiota bacterium]|nr:Gfo/Idh/MocA family oxidoreductase [Verrucomicrobiota bacterium]
MSNQHDSLSSGMPRRRFINSVAIAGAAISAAPLFNIRAQNAARKFKVGVVGCGGRGNDALRDISEAAKIVGVEIEVVAVADFFQDRASKTAQKHNVPESRVFTGATGYREVIAQPLDIVLLATPPAFRPAQFEAAVQAGRHCFIEKPVAVDPPGARKIIEVGELAKSRGLSVVAGTQRRHSANYLRNQAAVEAGAIGKILGGTVSWCQRALWFSERKPDDTDASYMARNWVSFTETSGDHIVEQHVHNLDVANWFIGRTPQTALGFGGRARRKTGNQYDFFSVDYNYGDDCHIHSMCRQINGCDGNVGEFFVGTEGSTYGGGKMQSAKLSQLSVPEFRTHNNGQVQEQVDLLRSIMDEKPLSEARQIAESTLTALMGRIAAYTGRLVRWSELTANTESDWYNLTLSPSAADFEKGTVVAPKDGIAPIPGEPA